MFTSSTYSSTSRVLPAAAVPVTMAGSITCNCMKCILSCRQRQTDAKLGIEDANQRFYDAFRSGSVQVRIQEGLMTKRLQVHWERGAP